MNFIFVVAYWNRKKRIPIRFTWFLILLFCLYAFWDTDYFSFRYMFYSSLEDFRDPLYYYLSKISFGSYTIFRFLIWGAGLLLVIKTVKRFGISPNIAAYVFTIFFMLTFSYARVSLGMAMFFYGLSYIIIPNKCFRVRGYIWGLIFIGCSFFGHRSLAALIALTPLAFIKLEKKIFILLTIGGIMASSLVAALLSSLMSGTISLGDSLGAVGEAAEQYAAKDTIMEYNWKFTLMRNLRNISIILAYAYIVWKVLYSKQSSVVSCPIKKLTTLCYGILIFSVSFLIIPGMGADIIGYRYLYMLGIPLCIIISYFATKGFCKPRTIILLLLMAFLYAEGFIFGKILSF